MRPIFTTSVGVLCEREQSMLNTFYLTGLSALATVGLAIVACGGGNQPVPCESNADCNGASGGLCIPDTEHNAFCAYPDSSCSDGYRFGADDVGDGAAGICVPDGAVYKLTVNVGGNGMGAVTSSPAGIACNSGMCTGLFQVGTKVDLAANATIGSFLGWSEVCHGKATCSVTMTADQEVGALFGVAGSARWFQQIGGPGEDVATGIAADSDGNLVAAGVFGGTINIGQTTLTSAGPQALFVAKFDGVTGDLIWAKQFGGATATRIYLGSVAIDDSHHIYVGSSFGGTIDLGSGTFSVTGGSSDDDAFILKLDTSGAVQWVEHFGSPYPDQITGIAVRGGKVAAVGIYGGAMFVGGTTITPQQVDVFAIEFGQDGTFGWLTGLGGTMVDEAGGIAIDSQGNVVIDGSFQASADFGDGHGTVTSAGRTDIFVAKLAAADGAHLFVKHMGGLKNDYAQAIALDDSDNIFVTGTFLGTVDFGGPSALVADGDVTGDDFAAGELFIAKYTLGGAYQWAKGFGVSGKERAYGLTTNSSGDVALAGTFCGSLNFGGETLVSANDCNPTTSGVRTDIFAARLAGADGGYINAVRGGGAGSEIANSVAQTADGSFYVCGDFTDFSEFGGQGYTSAGGADGYVLALEPL
jgi:hypothetical protein